MPRTASLPRPSRRRTRPLDLVLYRVEAVDDVPEPQGAVGVVRANWQSVTLDGLFFSLGPTLFPQYRGKCVQFRLSELVDATPTTAGVCRAASYRRLSFHIPMEAAS